jgi:hypothetical protein
MMTNLTPYQKAAALIATAAATRNHHSHRDGKKLRFAALAAEAIASHFLIAVGKKAVPTLVDHRHPRGLF